MEEIWKDIYYTDSITGELVDYRGLYQVSNLSRVKSVERFVNRTKNGKTSTLTIHSRFIARKTNGVYPVVSLYKDNKPRYYLLHRVVAHMFVPNPKGYEIVNHKDCNPLNANADNLEWCDVSYNVTYNGASKNRAKKQMRECLQYSLNGEFIRKWDSYTEAADAYGLNRGAISNCVLGHSHSYGGYMWKAPSEPIQERIEPYNKENLYTGRKRKVVQCDDNWNEIKIFNSIRAAAQEFNINQSNISLCLIGRNKTAAGYKWKYANQDRIF